MKIFIGILVFLSAGMQGLSQKLAYHDWKFAYMMHAEPKHVNEMVKLFGDSKKPLHVYFDCDSTLKPEHFEALSRLNICYMRFHIRKPQKFYCSGLDKLHVDTLELGGQTHLFLEDASKIKELKRLHLTVFIPDSTLTKPPAFDQITSLHISLSPVKDISTIIGSLKKLKLLDLAKMDAGLDLVASMNVLKDAPIEELWMYLVNVNVPEVEKIGFPNLKKCVLRLNNVKTFPYTDFIGRCPKLESIDLTANGFSEKYIRGMQEKYPHVKIIRDY
ncbi:MAG TPA: hypothetical protein VK177_16120 [Flavobacteriales bacterium]|nr:hypothetical protein [Flavobacteriales bacterium]